MCARSPNIMLLVTTWHWATSHMSSTGLGEVSANVKQWLDIGIFGDCRARGQTMSKDQTSPANLVSWGEQGPFITLNPRKSTRRILLSRKWCVPRLSNPFTKHQTLSWYSVSARRWHFSTLTVPVGITLAVNEVQGASDAHPCNVTNLVYPKGREHVISDPPIKYYTISKMWESWFGLAN